MKKIFILILIIIPLISGLSLTSAQTRSFEISLNFENLADPGDEHYEGWVIEDGTPISTGKFTLDDNNKIVDLEGVEINSFNVEGDLDLVTKFVLTLEPSGDTDTTPSAIKLIAGDFDESKGTAQLAHNIGADFSSISGSYILATPTNGDNTDENSGIWFLDPTGGSPVAGLDLPDLTETDWIYEGWVVVDGTPVTTGTFEKPSKADLDDQFSGTEDAPPFPGEDFLVNAPSGLTFPVDLAGDTAVISVEPREDNSEAPFQFKPLVGSIASDAVDHTLYSLDDKSGTLPTGLLNVESSKNALPLPNLFIFIGMIGLISVLTSKLRSRPT